MCLIDIPFYQTISLSCLALEPHFILSIKNYNSSVSNIKLISCLSRKILRIFCVPAMSPDIAGSLITKSVFLEVKAFLLLAFFRLEDKLSIV